MNAQNELIYAGLQTRMMPMGTTTTQRCIMLRPDGTYVKDFKKSDWNSRIDGKYKRQSNGDIILYKPDGE